MTLTYTLTTSFRCLSFSCVCTPTKVYSEVAGHAYAQTDQSQIDITVVTFAIPHTPENLNLSCATPTHACLLKQQTTITSHFNAQVFVATIIYHFMRQRL